MTGEVIIIGFSNPTPEGVVLHLNIPATIKTGNIQSKEFWVSWDKIGASLLEGYTTKTLVDDLNAFRQQFQSAMPAETPTSGVSLIAMERSEQIYKHHRTLEQDREFNNECQLSFAAAILTAPNPFAYARESNNFSCPSGWNKILWTKMLSKSYKDRLIIAGALLAAEIDRINTPKP